MSSSTDQTGSGVPVGSSSPSVISESSFFLNPQKVPREVRDKIYEIVIKDAFWLGTRKMAPDGTWRCTYFHDRPEDDSDEGRGRDPPRVFPSMLGVCKQIQDEFVERMHARLKFVIRIFDYQNADFLGIPAQIPFIDFTKIQHLILHLWVEPAHDFSFEAGHENAFIREPYSVRYNTTRSLQGATLHRSESSQSPTPYFDVKKYGCPNDHALPQVVQAHKVTALPTRYTSKFGRSLNRLLVAMGESNELLALELRVVLPFDPRKSSTSPETEINSPSGINEFLRPLELLHGLKEVNLSVKRGAGLSEGGQVLNSLLRHDFDRLESQLKSDRSGCNLSVDTLCTCKRCFPPLPDRKIPAKNAVEPEPEDAYSQGEIDHSIERVEWVKHEISDQNDSTLPEHGSFPIGYEEDALARQSRFCVGINKHNEDDFDCGCPRCAIDRGQW